MSTPALEHAECRSCGAAIEGHYCPSCGEPAVHADDLAVSHLWHDFLHEFTHLDGKIWRTIKALLIQPGLLTTEYWSGRRGLWVRPLRLYLVISALTLLLAPNAAGPLGMRAGMKGEGNIIFGTQPFRTGISPVSDEFNHRIQSVYLWTRYLSLAGFAAASLLLARKKQPYYGAHLIFAMHFYSFEYLLSGLMVRTFPMANPSVGLLAGWIYLLLAVRRIYGLSWLRSAGRSFLLYIAVSLTEIIVLGGTVVTVLKLFPAHH